MRSRLQPPPSWVHPRCECGKVLCLDRTDAKRWRQIYADHNGNHNLVRYYVCGYGRWHWTSDTEGITQS